MSDVNAIIANYGWNACNNIRDAKANIDKVVASFDQDTPAIYVYIWKNRKNQIDLLYKDMKNGGDI